MRQPKTDADVIIESMMPSAWATYKQSLRSSVIGFVRVMFYYKGTDAHGNKADREGIVPSLIIEPIAILVSLFKILMAISVGALSITLFLASPFVNLAMLPFYRRKSKKELKIFIEQQAAELEKQRGRVKETLTGAV